MSSARPRGHRGAHWFSRLGRWVVRHPWYPIIFWVVLLLVTVPFLSRLGAVTTNSTTTLPASSPSAKASAEFAQLFPNDSAGSSTILLFYGPNLTGPNAQHVVMNVTTALTSDRSLANVSGVSSVYTAYSEYLVGQVELAGEVLSNAIHGPDSVPLAINSSATLLWAPPALFLQNWQALVQNGTSPPQANYPAFVQTDRALPDPNASSFLAAFYAEFNDTTGRDCAANPSAVVSCTNESARLGEPAAIAHLPGPAQPIANATLAGLGVTNFGAWPAVQSVTVAVVSGSVGLPAAFLGEVWTAFPSAMVPPSSASTWADAVVAASTLWTEPLPVPHGILAQYVAPDGEASVVNVAFSVADDSTNRSGGDPVYSDLGKIDSLVPPIVRAHDSSGTIRYVQTGGSALDLLTQNSVNSTLVLVLPLTVGLLLAIAMIYFRSPITPLVTFAALGIALVLALGGTVLVGTLVGPVDTTSLTLEEVFVLGVGTDYSIFLTARYREELVHGRSSDEAIIESVTWAGQSVATSGSTAIIATLALTFSGIALLSQWGSVLSLAILITLLLSLTTIPAFLKLLGPRIFWPTTGERFSRHAVKASQRTREESTYFYRVGRATQRRPLSVIGVIVLVSVPLVAVALTVPLSYDFYAQLPAGAPATNGLVELGHHFGDGFAVPSYALVTFRAPLLVGTVTNATEFSDLAALTARANSSSGIAQVRSPIGPFGASLATWLDYSGLPIASRTDLAGTLGSFLGTDERTVLVNLVTTSTGLSVAAVSAVRGVESSFSAYAASHPEITKIAFGGGAPLIGDLADQTSLATDFLIVAVTIGLTLVLLAVLRSWIIAIMAIATIGLSISWAWSLTYLIFEGIFGFPLFFYVLTLLIMLVLGLGIDYNIFVLTRVREERLRGRTSGEAAVEAVGRTGGIITAAAVILASAFAAVTVGSFVLIRAIGFSVAIAVILDAMVVRTYLVPAALQVLGDRVWSLSGRGRRPNPMSPGASEEHASPK